MQTLKFKVKHEFADEILNYQREYSSLLHSAFEFIKRDDCKDSCFDYMKGTSPLVKYLKSLNNIESMNSWLIQCAVSEAFQLVQAFKLKQEDYKKKLQRKTELERKEKLDRLEKKELRRLQKVKEPKLVFGRKEELRSEMQKQNLEGRV